MLMLINNKGLLIGLLSGDLPFLARRVGLVPFGDAWPWPYPWAVGRLEFVHIHIHTWICRDLREILSEFHDAHQQCWGVRSVTCEVSVLLLRRNFCGERPYRYLNFSDKGNTASDSQPTAANATA